MDDAEIVENVQNENQNDDDDDDDEDADASEPDFVPPTSRQALDAVRLLQQFFQHHHHDDSLKKMLILENTVEDVHFSVTKTQTKITSFYQSSS